LGGFLKAIFFFILLIFISFTGAAQGETPWVPKHAIYADLAYWEEALENGGNGLGVGFEMIFTEHLGFRARHGIIQRGLGTSLISHTITSFLFTFYPKSEGMEGFNIALGAGYSNTQYIRDPLAFYQRIFPFVEFSAGYKIIFSKSVVLEPSLIWMVVVGDSDLATTGIHQIVDTLGLTLGIAF
jgi:hypothetical protein